MEASGRLLPASCIHRGKDAACSANLPAFAGAAGGHTVGRLCAAIFTVPHAGRSYRNNTGKYLPEIRHLHAAGEIHLPGNNQPGALGANRSYT